VILEADVVRYWNTSLLSHSRESSFI